MKQILLYIKLEWKRFIKLIPGFLAGVAALSLLAMLITFCAKNILSPDSGDSYKVKIALAFDDSSPLMEMLTEMLKEADCVSSICEFVDTDEDTARKMVENNEAAAALIIPEGFVESVKDGSNAPIDVEFADNSTIISLILRQLSVAGAGTLSAAQAGIYTQYDIYKNYGLLSYDDEANRYLNEVYLKYVLERGTIFHKIKASPTGSLSIPDYYKCAGAALVLLFTGISCFSFLCAPNPVFEAYSSAKGISYPIRFLTKLMVISVFSMILMAIPFPSIIQLAILIPAILCSNSIALLIFKLCPSPSTGIFALFIFNFVSAFLSGYFIPTSFMPDIIGKISKFLPAGMILKQYQYAQSGGIAATLALMAVTVLVSVTAAAVDKFYHKGGILS